MAGTLVPSDEYVALAITLLDSLAGDPNSIETALLQLQALFGPMLTSALQLVDKREVVRVSLPSDRYVYQVSGSTGTPYTLYLDCPDIQPEEETDHPAIEPEAPRKDGGDLERDAGVIETVDDARLNDDAEKLKRVRLRRETSTMRRSYCPCPGFAYNSLAGDKNVLCKHILAALIAWKTERAVRTEVSLASVLDLLNLRSERTATTDGVEVERPA